MNFHVTLNLADDVTTDVNKAEEAIHDGCVTTGTSRVLTRRDAALT